MPVSAFSELRLQETGGSAITGSGMSISFGLGLYPTNWPISAVGQPATAKQPPSLSIMKEKAALGFWVTTNGPAGKVLSVGDVSVYDLLVAGIRYQWLCFDTNGVLTWFTRSVQFLGSNISLFITGNTSGEGDVNYYNVHIDAVDSHQLLEDVSFTPELALKDRWVRSGSRHAPEYHEIYTNGKLSQRKHYGEKVTEQGTQSIIVRTEKFDK